MNTVLRFLGIMLVAGLAARLPGPLARLATAVVLVVVNLLPVWAVVTERIGMGDVFLVYWIENVVVWACGIVRTATAEGPGTGTVAVTTNGVPGDMSSAKFFALHYGIFTLVHGVFTIIVVALVGLEGRPRSGGPAVARDHGEPPVLAGGELVRTRRAQGGQPGRRDVRAVPPDARPARRDHHRASSSHSTGWSTAGTDSDQVTAVAILCVMKTLVDLRLPRRGSTARARSSARRRSVRRARRSE